MSAEVVETAPPVESNTSSESVQESIPDNITLDDLLAIGEEEVPEFKGDVNHTGMKPLSHWMKHVPEDVRKHLANIRRDYTIKTQQLSQMKRDLESTKEESMIQRDRLVNGPLAQKLKEVDEKAEYDLFDPEGMKKEIERQAALMLKSMLQPAQEQIELQQRKIELERFKASNPELTDPAYRSQIVELLKSRPELKLEDAFYITKAKIESQRLSEEKTKLSQQKAAAKEIALKSSSGSRTAPTGNPQFKSAIEAYKYHKALQSKK